MNKQQVIQTFFILLFLLIFSNSVNADFPKLLCKSKEITDNHTKSLEPLMLYFEQVNAASNIIDWTTSLPISPAPRSAQISGSTSFINDNIHTYYNSEISDTLLYKIQDYYRKKSINCTLDQIKIRYTSFDILRDLYQNMRIKPGDKALISSPTYGYYLLQTAKAGFTNVLLKAEKKNDWKIIPSDLERAIIAEQPKIFIFTNPVNPTGVYYSEQEIIEIADVLKKYDIICISDEIFSEIIFSPQNMYSLAAVDGMQNKTITLSGIGKSMGVRLSFAICPTNIIETLPTSGIIKPLQKAAIECLTDNSENQKYLNKTNHKYIIHKNYISEKIYEMNKKLQAHFGTQDENFVEPYIDPASTNIFLISFKGIENRLINGRQIKTSLDLSYYLLQTAKIATVPGEGFFIEDSLILRIPISVSLDQLEVGLNKILAALQK